MLLIMDLRRWEGKFRELNLASIILNVSEQIFLFSIRCAARKRSDPGESDVVQLLLLPQPLLSSFS